MKIVEIALHGYELRYAHGEYVMSGGRAAVSETGTLVRVSTDEGLEGWGEITPLGTNYLPVDTEGVRTALRSLAQALIGSDPTNLGQVNRTMDATLLGQTFAKSALDIACWDVFGQALGRPVVDLIGGRLAEDFPLYEAVPLGTPEAMADFVRKRTEAGIGQFQLKVGNDPYDDVARTRATRLAAPEDATIIADANGGWTILGAQQAIRAMSDLDVHVEQPCRSTEDCIVAHRGSSVPLVLDESILTAGDVFRAKHEAGAASINVKLSRVGGLTGAVRMRNLIQDLNLMISIEDAWGGDVITAAVSHVAASTKPEHLLTTSFFNDWTDGHVAGHTPRSRAGRGSAPTAPGLGVTVDPAAVGEPLIRVRA